MNRTIDELLAVVYRHYPRGLAPGDPGYGDTEEARRLADARRAAGASRVWAELLEGLESRFPERSGDIQNDSFHLPTGTMDGGYVGRIFLPPRDETETNRALGFAMSFLLPCYVVYSSSTLILGPPPPPSTDNMLFVHDTMFVWKGGKPGEPPPPPHERRETRFDFSPDEAPYVRGIVEEIRATFPGCEPMPPEVGHLVVPDVVPGNQMPGEATLYQCFFTDNLW